MESRGFTSAISFKISNIIDKATISQICERKGVQLIDVQNGSELLRLQGKYLVVCDLTTLNKSDLHFLAEISRVKNWQVLGIYPHVSIEVRQAALTEGIKYVVPRSSFKRKLEQITGS